MALRSNTLRRSRLSWYGLSASAPPPPPRATAAPTTPRPAAAPTPDLLHPEPLCALDVELLAPMLDFAFAGGDAAEPLGRLLAGFVVAPSEWDPSCFTRHLFVEELARSACPVLVDGRLVEIDVAGLVKHLTHPPADPGIRAHRARVLAELVAQPGWRAELVEIYRELRRLRQRLMHAPSDGRYEATRRRIAILQALRVVLERLAGSFEGARSGLGRLRELGRATVAEDRFARLVDLLEHEQNQAAVEVELQLGADGRVRRFAIQKLTERKGRYHRSLLTQLWTRLSFWLRGYGFGDAELIDRWLDEVFGALAPLVPGLLQLIGQAEFYLAALGFRDRALERGLAVCLPDMRREGPFHLSELFNPLLLAQGVRPVPCSLHLSGAGSTTVLTGPNSGGKTRLLQSLGLAQLLAQVGFFVPAREAALRAVPGLFCSLVQEEAFDQSEGRLGSELLRIRRVFEKAPAGALVIVDELCSGTNPSEGEEIFTLVVSLLAELAPETFVTTHFLGFAKRLSEEPSERRGLRFLQVELDLEQRPTFGFVPGVAETSLAAQAAARLGVTREEIQKLVRARRPA